MKKITSLIIVISIMASLLFSFPVSASTAGGICGDDLMWTLDSTGVLTIIGTGPMDDYSSSSATPWYDYKSDVLSVIISDGVTTIGQNAFCLCENLKNVDIPDSVTTIGASAFNACKRLKNITIPDGITSINNAVFANCNSLTNITIPSSVTSIGDSVFTHCDSMTTITIPGNVKTIGKNVFYDCDILATVTISDGVKTIGDYAFWHCVKLTSVTIPDSVTSIGVSAFHACYKLTGITIPDSVTSIGVSAFSDCKSLTSITIPNTVTTIGDYVFSDCNSLTNITISGSVTAIGKCAFSGCDSLTDVYYSGTVRQWNEIEIGSANSCLTNATIHFAEVEEDIYVAEGECGENLIWALDDTGTLTISGTGAMTDYSSMTSIPWYAYKSEISKVIIDVGVTTIGDCVFWSCENLTSITIPGSITTIGRYAFYNCNSLTDVYYAKAKGGWDLIDIQANNNALLNANITFNCGLPVLKASNLVKGTSSVTFDLSVSTEENLTGNIIVSLYKKDGTLPKIVLYPVDSNIKVSLDSANGDYIKVMWLEAGTWIPLSEFLRIDL